MNPEQLQGRAVVALVLLAALAPGTDTVTGVDL
jgi:hypothetical protein